MSISTYVNLSLSFVVKDNRFDARKFKNTCFCPNFFFQVWHCAFEPFGGVPEENSVFASCGGNSVCIIDARDASVKTKHYSNSYDENFHSLAWSSLPTLQGKINILAVAGSRSVLHLLHPDKAVCFGEFDLQKSDSRRKPKNPIESMIFHPKQPNILFGKISS